MWALLLAVPLYCFVRINNLWSGANAVELAQMITNEERAHSLEFRLVNEDLLIAKAFSTHSSAGVGGDGTSSTTNRADSSPSSMECGWSRSGAWGWWGSLH